MDKYAKILEIIENSDELTVIEKSRSLNILLDIIDNRSNTLLHIAASRNMKNLAEEILKMGLDVVIWKLPVRYSR